MRSAALLRLERLLLQDLHAVRAEDRHGHRRTHQDQEIHPAGPQVGGQVVVPGYGPPFVPSRYGTKYLAGLVQGPSTQVFVSRGLGTSGPPFRLGSRPEINLLTLTCPRS